MRVYLYLTNITKNKEIFLGKTGGLDLFNKNIIILKKKNILTDE
jgi:hypothetical protein